MPKNYDKLDETFNINSDSEKIEEAKKVEVSIVSDSENDFEKDIKTSKKVIDDIKKDYEYTRGNLYSIIEKGQMAINGILEIAEESDQPRAYEVAGQLIKNVADVAEKLIDLQKKIKDIDEETVKGPTNVTNALFVGSTAELSKLLKSQRKENKDSR